MLRYACILFATAGFLRAEVHSLTLRQALEIAARGNPDLTLARLDSQRAHEAIRVAQDPFRPKIGAGSGAAYTYGYPSSIDGNAPSLFEVKTDMALFNRPKSFGISSAKEGARGTEYASQSKADEVAYSTADLFLTASELEHRQTTISGQLPSLERMERAMSAAVDEGSELPLELTRAKVNLAQSKQRLEANSLDADYYEAQLAVLLGYPAADRVKPVDGEMPALPLPASAQEAADLALRVSKEMLELQSNLLAKELDLRSYRSAHLPQMDLVAQYSLFAKYNYQNYFQKFQRNNYQLGVSVTIPLFTGSAPSGLAEEAYTDVQRLRIKIDEARNRIQTDTYRGYGQLKKAESLRDVARLQLDLARQELTVLLAQNGEGRVLLSRVEQGRLDEANRWIELFEAETQVTRAQLAVLRQLGILASVIRAGSAPQPN